MKKKVLLGLVIIFGLFIITGCENNKKESNSNEKKSNDNDIVCTKSNDYGSWKEERSLTYKFDDDNKLIEVIDIEKYVYNNKNSYTSNCGSIKSVYEGIEKKSGVENKYECDDNNMTITMTRIETIKELDDDTKTKRYKQLNEDGTYNYEEWKNTTGKKNNWQCDK